MVSKLTTWKQIGIRRNHTYVWSLLFILALQYLPQHIHRRFWLDGDARLQAGLVNVPDQLLRIRLAGRSRVSGVFCSGRGDGGFVVKAIEVTSGGLELLDPFLRLRCCAPIPTAVGTSDLVSSCDLGFPLHLCSIDCTRAHLCGGENGRRKH